MKMSAINTNNSQATKLSNTEKLKQHYGIDLAKTKQNSQALGRKMADQAIANYHAQTEKFQQQQRQKLNHELNGQLKNDKVSLSQQALTKFAQENDSSAKTVNDLYKNDSLLEEFKEKIRKLKLELNKLKYDDSEQARQKRQQIQGQINAFNAIIMKMLGSKLSGVS